MLETLDHTIRIGSTPTFLYFDLYLYSAYAAHYVYNIYNISSVGPSSEREFIMFLSDEGSTLERSRFLYLQYTNFLYFHLVEVVWLQKLQSDWLYYYLNTV